MPERETRQLTHDEHGAIALVCLFMAVFLVASLFYLLDLGSALLYRERMQDAADATAYAAAVTHAKGMNTLALINAVMAALLAILVALNLIETFIIVAMTIIAACLPMFAFCIPFYAALEPLNEIRQAVEDFRAEIQPAVLTGLSMLHTVEHGLRLFIPFAAEAVAVETATAHYDPPVSFGFALPPRATLPTKDADYSVLCAKAGEYVADFALKPFPKVIKEPAKDFIDALVKADPKWFCAATDANRADETFDQKYTQGFPVLDARAKCAAADPLGDKTKALCQEAEAEDESGMPDTTTGECLGSCDPTRYAKHIAAARSQCNPNDDPKLAHYQWQERTIVKQYAMVGHTLQWLPEQDKIGLPTVQQADGPPPCPRSDDNVIAWNTTAGEPVCSWVTTPAGTTTQTVREVTNILRCDKPAVAKHRVQDMSKDPALGAHDPKDTSRSPQTMQDGVVLGSERFQLRAVVLGRGHTSYAAAVRVATWGKPTTDDLSILPKALEQLQVAQAEYYFDGSSGDPNEWLWHMDWKARLRRFRLPSNDDRSGTKDATPSADSSDDEFQIPAPSGDFATACSSAAGTDTSGDCSNTSSKLQQLGDWLVH